MYFASAWYSEKSLLNFNKHNIQHVNKSTLYRGVLGSKVKFQFFHLYNLPDICNIISKNLAGSMVNVMWSKCGSVPLLVSSDCHC